MKARDPDERPSESERAAEDRLRVLLVLSAHSPEETAHCPPAEDLAAFIDGRLDEKEREALFEHLDSCPQCYAQWLDVASSIEPEQAVGKDDREPGWKPRSFWDKRIWLYGTPALVSACLLLFVVWSALQRPDGGELLDRSFQRALSSGLLTREMLTRFDPELPWERSIPSFGFAAPKKPGEGARAFGAGMWVERAVLTGKSQSGQIPELLLPPGIEKNYQGVESWTDTPWSGYFELGRWCIYISAACQSSFTPDPAFWNEQTAIIRTLRDELSSESPSPEENEHIAKILEEIEASVYTDKKSDGSQKDTCVLVKPKMEPLIRHLAPIESRQ